MISKRSAEARKWSWLKLNDKLEPGERKAYITEDERKKCRRVAVVFNEVYKHENMLVIDAGRYGFVKLSDYEQSSGFKAVETFRNSQDLFDDLWKEWVCLRFSSLIDNSSLAELDYEDIFKSLPPHVVKQVNRKRIQLIRTIRMLQNNEEKKGKRYSFVKEVMQRFTKIFSISCLKLGNNQMSVKGRYHTTEEERKKCRRVASVFKDLYEHEDLVVLDAGRYGFIKLQDYKVPFGFGHIETFRNSHDLFEDLWNEWIISKLISLTVNSPLEKLEYEDIFESLPPLIMKRVNRKKYQLMKKAGLIF